MRLEALTSVLNTEHRCNSFFFFFLMKRNEAWCEITGSNGFGVYDLFV